MKKQIIKIKFLVFFSVIILFSLANTTYAALNIETEVDVPAVCTATDTNGVVHNYPETNSYLAICALQKALEQNVVSDIDFADFGFGLFINSVNNISENNTYWQLRLNNVSASVGVSDLTLQTNDTVSLVLTAFDPITFAETSLEDQVILHINSLITPPPPEPEIVPTPVSTSRGGGGGALAAINSSQPASSSLPSPITKKEFNIEKALEFIISRQKEDGSFGEDLYTDWISIALSSNENFQNQKTKLKTYLEGLKANDYQLTDYERHAMALMALGLNPYNTNNENYIKKITAGFDGKQFGDVNENNDDIFALIVLQNAGFTKDEEIIKNTVSHILSKQKENGSWNENADMSGAAIQALSAFSPTPGVGESLAKAKEFLKQNQKDDGGFGNVSSTAWALGGILALNEKPEDWVKNSHTPLDYLAASQDTDGGIKDENIQNKIWETAYSITALSGKTWNKIMQKFEKQEEIKGQSLEDSARTVLKNTESESEKIITEKKVQKKIVKKSPQKAENPEIQNTATVINSLDANNTRPTKKSWLIKFLENILKLF